MDYTEDLNNPGILFFSDFEKAFDTIDHDYMFHCLRHFNFGEDLINWIQLFYSNPQNAIMNNGHMTDFFKVKRGVRQGCPLSPYIFIICIELLSYEVEHNNNIKGINIEGQDIKRTLFADDATFITDGTENSFTHLINVLDNFSHISGLRLNSSKCNALRIGSTTQTDVSYFKHRKFQWGRKKQKH